MTGEGITFASLSVWYTLTDKKEHLPSRKLVPMSFAAPYSKPPLPGKVTVKSAAALLAPLLLLTGCVSGSNDSEDEANSSGEDDQSSGGGGEDPLYSTRLTNFSEDVRVDVNSLDRVDSDVTIMRFSLTNEGQTIDPIGFYGSLFAQAGEKQVHAPNGVTLVDAQNKKRHYPLETVDDACYCTSWEDTSPDDWVDEGDTVDAWIAFPSPPEGTESVTIYLPGVNPIPNIELGEGELREEEEAPGDLDDPTILDLTSYTDDLDGDTSQGESEDEMSILLSSDVLFETDESDLTNDATETLEQVAQEIDDASAQTVQVDGHTDNTGNNEINIPLSEDRAESVETELTDLITRDDVEFEAEGHGSEDPVATNKTEAGKEKNRRVTVTFAK